MSRGGGGWRASRQWWSLLVEGACNASLLSISFNLCIHRLLQTRVVHDLLENMNDLFLPSTDYKYFPCWLCKFSISGNWHFIKAVTTLGNY